MFGLRGKRRLVLASAGGVSMALVLVLAMIFTSAPLPTFAVAPQAQPSPGSGDWPLYGNDMSNERYQNFDQISTSNVSQLKPAWVFHTGLLDEHASFEATPIVVNGTMYVTTGHDDVYALDAATGAEKWAYHPESEMPPLDKISICCGRDNRGVAYGDGKVYIGRLDGILVALNAQTGQVAWKAEVEEWQNNYALTMAPQFVNGEVIIGTSGGEYKIRGHVDAFDASNGNHLWRFYTTEPGTWAGDSWKTGGAPVWTTPAVDPQLGMLYFPTGNAAPDLNGSMRAGKNLYTASVVALDIKTGKLQWYFQEVHHDIWDYDGPQPAILFDVKVNGQTIPAIGHGNKNGFYYILDRRNGQPIYAAPETPVDTSPSWQNPWPTQPESSVQSLIPHKLNSQPADPYVQAVPQYTAPMQQPQAMQPGPHGGYEWPPMAYSPRTKYVYLNGAYDPHSFQAFPSATAGFASNANSHLDGISKYGIVGAIDTSTGKIAWQMQASNGIFSGMTVAGDLVFFGKDDGTFYAADAKSGKILWSFHSSDPYVGGASAGPISYMANGQEFIADAFGGTTTERGSHLDPMGDAVIAFALPSGSYSGATQMEATPFPTATPAQLTVEATESGESFETPGAQMTAVAATPAITATIAPTPTAAFTPIVVPTAAMTATLAPLPTAAFTVTAAYTPRAEVQAAGTVTTTATPTATSPSATMPTATMAPLGPSPTPKP